MLASVVRSSRHWATSSSRGHNTALGSCFGRVQQCGQRPQQWARTFSSSFLRDELPTTTPEEFLIRSPWSKVSLPEDSVTQVILNKIKTFGTSTCITDAITGDFYSFQDLGREILQVAANLQRRGFKKGDVLAIYAVNCIEWPVIFHAVSLIGAISTPVGPQHNAEELSQQLNDSRAKAIFVSPELRATAIQAAHNINLNTENIFVIGKADHDPTHPKTSDYGDLRKPHPSDLPTGGVPSKVAINPRADVALLPYSSGTTGKPKGVMLSHRNLVANLMQIAEVEPLTPSDSLVGILPFWHSYGLMLILNSSIYGGSRMAVLPKFDINSFLSCLQDHKVTRAHVAPPIIVMLAKHPAVSNYDLSSLKVIFSGAAPLGASTEETCAKRLNCKIKQAYGLTETSPAANITPDDKILIGSMGPPISNTIMKVVDPETGVPLPRGQVGELCIKGPQVMMGYLNRPEETEKAFDKEGFLKTGDTARFDEDGYGYIIDRVKELIKYKGHQIAPAELEEILLTHPAIADAAVVGKKSDEATGELPKAFVVLKPTEGPLPTAPDIMTHVANRVAVYKRVREVVFIDAIPKSPSGKILRRLLRDHPPK